MIDKKKDYNNVPIKYCNSCLSLKILSLKSGKNITKDIEYCGNCGNTIIEECHISKHEIKYQKLYGRAYITRNK